jgi:hypothetical protein
MYKQSSIPNEPNLDNIFSKLLKNDKANSDSEDETSEDETNERINERVNERVNEQVNKSNELLNIYNSELSKEIIIYVRDETSKHDTSKDNTLSSVNLSNIDNVDLSSVMLLKIKFHEIITKFRKPEYVALYDEIFNDNLYNYIKVENDVIKTTEWLTPKKKAQLISEYNEEVDKINKKNLVYKLNYEEGEIIGAKNIYDQWWMSKILKIIKIEGKVIYYVEFLGWGKDFNEFIYCPLRMAKFNKFKHNYYRKPK